MNKQVVIAPSRSRRHPQRDPNRVVLDRQPEMAVRLATMEDRPSILDLCLQLHRENGKHPLAPPKMEWLVDRGLWRQNAIMAVIGEPQDIRAMLLLFIDDIYYSDEKQLLELWNFVRWDSRRSNYARQLLDFAVGLSERTGYDLTIGIISNERLEAKTAMYDRVISRTAENQGAGLDRGSYFIYRPRKELSDGR
jgi:hypothetical protein